MSPIFFTSVSMLTCLLPVYCSFIFCSFYNLIKEIAGVICQLRRIYYLSSYAFTDRLYNRFYDEYGKKIWKRPFFEGISSVYTIF